MTLGNKKEVLLFVSVDWYFCMHWLPLARAMLDAGFAVTVMTEITGHEERIRAAGLHLIPVRLSRGGMNPFRELSVVWQIIKILRRVRPDLAHNIAQKPVLYGTLAARLVSIGAIVDTLPGLGFLFISSGLKARLLRPLVVNAYRGLLGGKHVRVIAQNPEDKDQLMREAGVNATLIRGAGVDLERFRPTPEAPGTITVLLASRMLWDKGVKEFVQAAQRLAAKGVRARFALAGKPDEGNPTAVPEERLREWHARGDVEWWGYREDMPEVLAQAHVVSLPSYREGLPTILIEAAAAGRPLVATDVPGCREVVRDQVNGFLVPPRDAAALASAIELLIRDAGLRTEFGRRSRYLAETEFGIDRVTAATLDLYAALLSGERQ